MSTQAGKWICFFYWCVNMAWGVKGTGSLPLSILHIFYNQRVPVMLQRVHATSLLKHAIAIGEGSSRLGVLAKGPPFSLFICFSWREGFEKLDVPLVVTLLGGSFVFLDVGPSILSLLFPFFFFGGALVNLWAVEAWGYYNIQKQF